MVSDFNTKTRSNLVLPLTWRSFGIDSRNLDSCIAASLVVSVGNVSSEDFVGSLGAIVWSFVSWESSLRPTVGLSSEPVVFLKDTVLLLDSVPWFMLYTSIPNLLCKVSEVRVGWE